MKWLRIMPLIFLLLVGCATEEEGESPVAPVEVTINDANEDGVWHAGPEQGILGNTDVWFIPTTLQGSAIWVINGPANAVGFDVSMTENTSLIYFADSYIAAGGNEAQTGTLIPENIWVHIRVVVYKNTLPGWIIQFLEFLEDTFFDFVEPDWIEGVFEADILLVPGGSTVNSIQWKETTHLYVEK